MTSRREIQRDARRAARERIDRLARAGLPPDCLAEALVETLRAAIGGDGYRLFGVDPRTRLVSHVLAASPNDGWARREWLRDIYLSSPPCYYIEHDELMRLGLAAVAIQARQEQCWGYPSELLGRLTAREHARHFNELGSPVGGTLLAHFADGRRWLAVLQFYRRDAGQPFTQEDVAFVRRIAPAIGQELGAAQRRQAAGAASGDAPDPAGVLLLTPEREVTVATAAGESWLRRLHDSDAADDGLPTALWSAVAGLRASGAPAVRLDVPTARGTVGVEASWAGSDGSVAVVLAPPRASAPPVVPPAWGLTAREEAVVELLVRGLSNREIAAALFISENTVEFHLRHAYDKLGVSSRAQALARFFRDACLPGMAKQDA